MYTLLGIHTQTLLYYLPYTLVDVHAYVSGYLTSLTLTLTLNPNKGLTTHEVYIIEVYEGGTHGKLPVEGRFEAVDESLAVTHTLHRFIQYRAVERLFFGGANSSMIEGAYLSVNMCSKSKKYTACI